MQNECRSGCEPSTNVLASKAQVAKPASATVSWQKTLMQQMNRGNISPNSKKTSAFAQVANSREMQVSKNLPRKRESGKKRAFSKSVGEMPLWKAGQGALP